MENKTQQGSLFLAGGGSSDISFNLDAEFFQQLKPHSHILYIPVALDRDTEGYKACLEWFKGLTLLHLQAHPKITMILENDTVPELSHFDAIFIGGGCPYKLLHFMKKNALINRMGDFIAKGGIICGGSAGAMIFGADVRADANDELVDKYPDYKGFNWLNGVSVLCHYSAEKREQMLTHSESLLKGPIYALPENGGLILDPEFNLLKTIGQTYICHNSFISEL